MKKNVGLLCSVFIEYRSTTLFLLSSICSVHATIYTSHRRLSIWVHDCVFELRWHQHAGEYLSDGKSLHYSSFPPPIFYLRPSWRSGQDLKACWFLSVPALQVFEYHLGCILAHLVCQSTIWHITTAEFVPQLLHLVSHIRLWQDNGVGLW